VNLEPHTHQDTALTSGKKQVFTVWTSPDEEAKTKTGTIDPPLVPTQTHGEDHCHRANVNRSLLGTYRDIHPRCVQSSKHVMQQFVLHHSNTMSCGKWGTKTGDASLNEHPNQVTTHVRRLNGTDINGFAVHFPQVPQRLHLNMKQIQ
jgi:hypothetical protein